MDICKLILDKYIAHNLNFIGKYSLSRFPSFIILGMARQNEENKVTKT